MTDTDITTNQRPLTVGATMEELAAASKWMHERNTRTAIVIADLVDREIERRRGVSNRGRLSDEQRKERNRINSANYRKRQAEQRDP